MRPRHDFGNGNLVTGGVGWAWACSGGAASGVMLGLSFPAGSWGWLGWIALVPLFLVLARAQSLGPALSAGYVAGVIFFAESCPWILPTVHHFGDLSGAVAALVFVLFLLLMGSYLALFGLAGYWLGRRLGHRLLPLPFVWLAVEWLRTCTPMGGFPWNLLGYAAYRNASVMRLAPLTGIYGVSLLLAAANGCLALLVLRIGHERPLHWRRWAPAAVGLAAIAAFALWPYVPPPDAAPALRVRLLQPNTPLEGTWTAEQMNQFLAAQTRLSEDAGAPPAQLIVWPEQPAPLNYPLEPELQRALAEIMAHTHAGLLLEEVSYPLTPTGAPNYDLPRNSSQYIGPDGSTGPRYDKIHLVPFGEYVPLPDWIAHLGGVGKLVQGVGNFVPGTRPALFDLDGHAFATMICYESIFPSLARQEVRMGAEWLVNQSDDSWYGHSSAAAQGLMMAQVRAMENRRWLLRSTDDGYTAVVDPWGRITAELPRFQPGVLDAGFSPRTDLTFYTRHGDWPANLCLLLTLGLAVWGYGRNRGPAPQ